MRQSETVARYGGEEILIIAPYTRVSDAADLAERLRRLVEATDTAPADEETGRQALRVTVSIGVSALSSKIVDQRSLVESADQALYRAKNAGRNRVVVSELAGGG